MRSENCLGDQNKIFRGQLLSQAPPQLRSYFKRECKNVLSDLTYRLRWKWTFIGKHIITKYTRSEEFNIINMFMLRL